MNVMKQETRTITCKHGDKIYGSALLAEDNESLVFLLVGLDYNNRDAYDVYFNLIYTILAIAIQNKAKRLDLGQTSYYLKQRIGGTCSPVYFYIKSRKRIINYLLKRFRVILFPETKISEHNVFTRLPGK
jgi:hypothetical protein